MKLNHFVLLKNSKIPKVPSCGTDEAGFKTLLVS